MRKVMIALDGSPLAEQAIPQALARLSGPADELLLLRVVEPTVDLIQEQGPGPQEARAYLEDWAQRLRDRGLLVRTLVRTGEAPEQIVRAAAQESADVLLVNSHGHSGLSRWLLGSVAEKVCRASPCPVWMIGARREPPKTQEELLTPAPPPKTVLVPLDTSPLAEMALTYLESLAPRPRLRLLSAVDMLANSLGNVLDASHFEQTLRALQDYLEERAGPLREAGFEVATQVVEGFAAPTILDVAEREGVDLIVMATHGRSGVERWMLGSVAERVVRHSPCPVVLVRALPVAADLDHIPAQPPGPTVKP